MSLKTKGIPKIICPSSFSFSKDTPNTHPGGTLETGTCARGSSGQTLALGLKILTEDASHCSEERNQ
uniref:Uncharacterized protein n=1 Tax=Cyprinodon variegatus TaxID=28743 RepID=A0A3Q2D4P5_CYPVA